MVKQKVASRSTNATPDCFFFYIFKRIPINIAYCSANPACCWCLMGPPFPSDFPRMDHWSENASQADFRPFMDGFLYLCWSQAKTPADRRLRDGESIHQRR